MSREDTSPTLDRNSEEDLEKERSFNKNSEEDSKKKDRNEDPEEDPKKGGSNYLKIGACVALGAVGTVVVAPVVLAGEPFCLILVHSVGFVVLQFDSIRFS